MVCANAMAVRDVQMNSGPALTSSTAEAAGGATGASSTGRLAFLLCFGAMRSDILIDYELKQVLRGEGHDGWRKGATTQGDGSRKKTVDFDARARESPSLHISESCAEPLSQLVSSLSARCTSSRFG
jgi:hypothetical protein